jgi:hypothetical protein
MENRGVGQFPVSAFIRGSEKILAPMSQFVRFLRINGYRRFQKSCLTRSIQAGSLSPERGLNSLSGISDPSATLLPCGEMKRQDTFTEHS